MREIRDRHTPHAADIDSIFVAPSLDRLRAHHADTADHSVRVLLYVGQFAEHLKLSPEQITVLKTAAVLHDIGKVSTPVSILSKKERLTAEEWDVLKNHPEFGSVLLPQEGCLAEVGRVLRSHHERWDGKGYPSGLKGEEIPYCARILSIADSLDAMTSSRSYRDPLTFPQAFEELWRCAGTQFDPNLVEAITSHALVPAVWPPPPCPVLAGLLTGGVNRECVEAKTVLMVDEDRNFLNLGIALLHESGLQVETADDGASALNSIAAHTPDVVVTDMEMPSMKGLELISRIRRDHPSLPILGISGAGWLESYLALSQVERCNRVMTKPINPKEFVHTVQALL